MTHRITTAQIISRLDNYGLTVPELAAKIGIPKPTIQARLRKSQYVPTNKQVRKIDCGKYEDCLTKAAQRDSSSMPCKYCTAYKPILRDYTEDIEGCARLLQALFPREFEEAGYEQG